MKRFYLSATAVLILLTGVFFLEKKTGTSGPEIRADKSVINLGSLLCDAGEQDIKFTIVNEGDSDLRISRIKAACPCMKPKLGKSILAPGEVTFLTLKVTPPTSIGSWSDSVMVFSNSVTTPQLRLTMKAFIEQRCSVMPDHIKIDGLKKGSPKEVKIKVLGPTKEPEFKVTAVTSSSKAIEVLDIKDEGIEPGFERKLWRVTLRISAASSDKWSGKVVLATTDRENKSIDIGVEVEEFRQIEFSPRLICFSGAADRDDNSRIIEVFQAEEYGGLEIEKIVAPDWLKVEQVKGDISSGRLYFRVAAEPDKKIKDSSDDIKLYFKDFGSINIPVILM